MEKAKGPSGDMPVKVDLVKKPLILDQGFILCCKLSADGKNIYFGLGSGKILMYDVATKLFEVIGKNNVGIYDIIPVSQKKVATVDNNSIVRFFSKGKLVETLQAKSQFLSSQWLNIAHANQIGKVLCFAKSHIIFISQTQSSFFKVNPKSYKVEEVPFEGTKVFQISAVEHRVYAIREDGFVEVVYRKGDNLGVKPPPKAPKDPKNPAAPGAKPGMNPGGKKAPATTAAADSEDEEEEEEADAEAENQAMDENGEIIYFRKSIKLEDIQEEGDLDANNISIIAGSEPEDDHEDEPDEATKGRAKSATNPLLSLANKPITNCFFRTIAANDKYVVAVAHDGKGNNTMYVFDAALNLLATKRIKIKKGDYSFNMNAYIHKLELVNRGPRLAIFAISQKYEYKLFIFEYYQNDIKTVKKYRNVHTSRGLRLHRDDY